MKALMKRNGTHFPNVPSFFDDFFTRDLFDWSFGNQSFGNTLPAVNVMETNDKYELEVAAPGMTKNDFNIELDNNVLVISSSREMSNDEKDKAGNYTRREFSYQSFKRSFNLPENMVQADKISAKYADGVLRVVIPKTEAAKVKPPKMIKIS